MTARFYDAMEPRRTPRPDPANSVTEMHKTYYLINYPFEKKGTFFFVFFCFTMVLLGIIIFYYRNVNQNSIARNETKHSCFVLIEQLRLK